jgi:hypothetical protein
LHFDLIHHQYKRIFATSYRHVEMMFHLIYKFIKNLKKGFDCPIIEFTLQVQINKQDIIVIHKLIKLHLILLVHFISASSSLHSRSSSLYHPSLTRSRLSLSLLFFIRRAFTPRVLKKNILRFLLGIYRRCPL